MERTMERIKKLINVLLGITAILELVVKINDHCKEVAELVPNKGSSASKPDAPVAEPVANDPVPSSPSGKKKHGKQDKDGKKNKKGASK